MQNAELKERYALIIKLLATKNYDCSSGFMVN